MERKHFPTIKPRSKTSSTSNIIDLPSLNNVTLKTIPICTKIQSLIHDSVFQRIFSHRQLIEVLSYIYANDPLNSRNGKSFSVYESKSMHRKNTCLKIGDENIKFFATQVRKMVSKDIVHGSRYGESQILNPMDSNFLLSPIKLYQQKILSKYCLCRKTTDLPAINVECVEIFKKSEFESIVAEVTPEVQQHPVDFQQQQSPKDNIISGSSAKIDDVKRVVDRITNRVYTVNDKGNYQRKIISKTIMSTLKTQVHENTFHQVATKKNTIQTSTTEIKQDPNEEIVQESEAIFTKANYKGYVQPRLSRENIQELIRQSPSNVLNKEKELIYPNEIRTSLRKSRSERSSQRRRSTISESHFTESGDFEFSNGEPVENANTDDLIFNESICTKMALNSTQDYINSTENIQDTTRSGSRLGENERHKNYIKKSKYDGNFGRIDGITLGEKALKKFSFVEEEKGTNETFSALSHLYSLRKLMERKSVIITHEQMPFFSSLSHSFSKVNQEDDDSFQSESSEEESTQEEYQSCDVKLIKIFKSKIE